jgi:hypothetical protein
MLLLNLYRETVPQETMNLAVELHHGLVRKLLRKHRGYGERVCVGTLHVHLLWFLASFPSWSANKSQTSCSAFCFGLSASASY